jgi:hypothetical protein
MPTFLVYKDNEVVAQIVGTDRMALREAVRKATRLKRRQMEREWEFEYL